MCSITSKVTLASRLSGSAALGVSYLPLFTVFEILEIFCFPTSAILPIVEGNPEF